MIFYLCLDVTIEENSYNDILKYMQECGIPRLPTIWQMQDKETFLQEEVTITCEVEGAAQWYKSGVKLASNPRLSITKDQGFSRLHIKNAVPSDAGFYECHQQLPKPTITKCRLLVCDHGCPRDVKVTHLSPNVVNLTWKSAPGNVSGYKVFYNLTADSGISGTLKVEGQNTNSCIITNLLPGQDYTFSVVSLSGLFESGTAKTGTSSLKMPTLHEALIEASKPVLQQSLMLKTEEVVKYMTQRKYITDEEGDTVLKCTSNKLKLDALIALLMRGREEVFIEFLVTLYQIELSDTADLLCKIHIYPNFIKGEVERRRAQLQLDETETMSGQDLQGYEEVVGATRSLIEGPDKHYKVSDTDVRQYVLSLPEGDTETVSSFPATVVSKDSGISSGIVPVNPKARVVEAYTADDDTELTLEVGDIVTVLEQMTGEVWKGDVRGQEGLFPHRCVKIIDLQAVDTNERREDEESLRKELKELIKTQGTKTSELKTLNDHILELTKLCNSTAASAGRAEEVGMYFHDIQWLFIRKKPESKSVSPELPATRWQAVQDTLLPQHVKGVLIHTVKLGSCTESVLDFTSKCTNLERFDLATPPSVKVDQKATVQGLVAIGKHLHDLVSFDVRGTPLGTGWQDVLSAISRPHLRLLSLPSNKLSRCGQHLADCLARLPLLSWLGLNNSGLSREGLVAVLDSLPTSCPHLVALLLGGNTLPDQGGALSNAVKNLPKLKLLTFGNCKLIPKSQFSIMQNCNERIELLETCINDSFTKKEKVLRLIEQRPRLLYLQLSRNQLSPRDQEQLAALLQARGGRLIMRGTADPGWPQYQNYIIKVAEECRTKL